MKELMEYRVKLVDRLREAAGEFCEAGQSIPDPDRIVEGEWTIHQIISHTRDVEKNVYGMRIRRTLNEENPTFKNFEADDWMKVEYRKDEPLTAILGEFSASVEELCQMLGTLPTEAWSRLSRHESLSGDLPMQLWVERSLAHIEEHLATLKKAKNQ